MLKLIDSNECAALNLRLFRLRMASSKPNGTDCRSFSSSPIVYVVFLSSHSDYRLLLCSYRFLCCSFCAVFRSFIRIGFFSLSLCFSYSILYSSECVCCVLRMWACIRQFWYEKNEFKMNMVTVWIKKRNNHQIAESIRNRRRVKCVFYKCDACLKLIPAVLSTRWYKKNIVSTFMFNFFSFRSLPRQEKEVIFFSYSCDSNLLVGFHPNRTRWKKTHLNRDICKRSLTWAHTWTRSIHLKRHP